MKINIYTILFTTAILFMVLKVTKPLQPHHYINSATLNQKGSDREDDSYIHSENNNGAVGAKMEIGMELYPTGSSLPDCSHACGPCFPCKRVMVSFKCSTESCPTVYRCMCKGKYYHVPSN